MNYLIKEKCEKIAYHYCERAQKKIMIEECAELTKAICKLEREDVIGYARAAARRNYIEELADVTIMAEQLYLLLSEDEREKLEKVMTYKLERQEERMEESK